MDLDISLAHPWSSKIIAIAAYLDGAAVVKTDEKEHKKTTGLQLYHVPQLILHKPRQLQSK